MNRAPFLKPDAIALKSIAARVRALRLDRGWTQNDLAGRAGLSPGTYVLFEHTGKVSLERLYRIAVALQRAHEFDELFKPQPIRSLDELSPRPKRQRARRAG